MPKTATVHAKVLRAHPELSCHPGEILELSEEQYEKYAEKEGYFIPATEAEIAKQRTFNEAATQPQTAEHAMLPSAGTKTGEQAADLLKKGIEQAKK